MINLKNALAAGTVATFAFIAPMTVAAQPAGADTVSGTTAAASTLIVQFDGGGSANGAANGSSGR
ncbi:hypothetical protein AB0395_33645 [Streptosporangium sp. NPDC051023]|uniref:hypothetical protein n=1 Tax=Streptosporangium sp. NPDC051023 TaxID=3155410 RepID=UPI00344DE62E